MQCPGGFECPRHKTGVKCSSVQCQSHADISRYLRAFPPPQDTRVFSSGYCSECSKAPPGSNAIEIFFLLGFYLSNDQFESCAISSAVAYSQTCLFWVTLKSHITSSTYHRIKLYKQPFLVFENHFTIAEANKFQKDPRTEILGYKTFKGHCTLRECFLSWGNIFLFGLLSFSPLALCFSLLLFFHSSEGN